MSSYSVPVDITSVLLVLAFLAIWAKAGAWVYEDARSRGLRPGHITFLVLFVAWPLGLVFWLAMRPHKCRPPF